LLFGDAVDRPPPPSPDPRQLFGYGVHHAVRARVCIERARYWQAEYWCSNVRDNALAMACIRLGLPASFGRGFDALPDDVRAVARGALVGIPDRPALLDALKRGTNLLLSEGALALVSTPHLAVRLAEVTSMEHVEDL